MFPLAEVLGKKILHRCSADIVLNGPNWNDAGLIFIYAPDIFPYKNIFILSCLLKIGSWNRYKMSSRLEWAQVLTLPKV